MKKKQRIFRYCKKNKKRFETTIITGSFKIIAEFINEELGVDHIFAKNLFIENDETTREINGTLRKKEGKGKVLKKLLSDLKTSYSKRIAVGDGANDSSMHNLTGYCIQFREKTILDKVSDVKILEKDLTKILSKIRDKTC